MGFASTFETVPSNVLLLAYQSYMFENVDECNSIVLSKKHKRSKPGRITYLMKVVT